MKVISDEVFLCWKLSSDVCYPVMKVILWWKLASDESYIVMKVKLVKEVKRSDGLWRFACGVVLSCGVQTFLVKYHIWAKCTGVRRPKAAKSHKLASVVDQKLSKCIFHKLHNAHMSCQALAWFRVTFLLFPKIFFFQIFQTELASTTNGSSCLDFSPFTLVCHLEQSLTYFFNNMQNWIGGG